MIPYGDPRKTSPATGETERAQVARRRAEQAAQAFPGRHARGLGLDFNAPDTAVAKSSGMGGSALDLYAPVFGVEDAKRVETVRRIDALPPEIAALPKRHVGLALDALESLAVLAKNSKVMGGNPMAVARGDIARSTESTPERAEAIITDLEQRSLIRRQVTAGTVSYFTVRL